MLYILFLVLIFLLYYTFIMEKRDVASPSFLFVASFVFSCFWAILYKDDWNLKLHFNTFAVIAGGCLIFVIICTITKFFLTSFSKRIEEEKETKLEYIYIEKYTKIVVVLFALLTIGLTINKLLKITGYPLSRLSDAMSLFDKNKFNDNKLSLGRGISYCRTIVNALGFWYVYVLLNNFICSKKIDILSAIIVVLSLVSSLITGSRGGAIIMILGSTFLFIILKRQNNEENGTFDLKLIGKILLIFTLILMVFQYSGRLIGRKSNSSNALINASMAEYLATYCGAEINNLDMFLQERWNENRGIFGSQTFIYVIRFLGPRLDINDYNYNLDLPYVYIGNHKLGNVYTLFYPLIYDFGYVGMVLLTANMAVITQVIYELTKRISTRDCPIICILVYSYMVPTIVLSFFSNKFYENIFNTNFVKMVILWYLFNFCMLKIRIKIRKNYYEE